MGMSSRERVLTALRCGEPDRVPYCEIGIDRVISHKLMGWPEPVKETSVEPKPYSAEEHKMIAAALKMDNICYELWPPVYAHKVASGDGRLFYADGMIKSEADLSLLQLPDPHDETLYTDAREFVRQAEDYAACFVTRIGILSAMMSMGLEGFCLALYDNRPLVEMVLDAYCNWTAVVVEHACQLGFDIFISTDDLAYNTGPYFSPKIFREMVFPRFRRVAERITLPWIMHTDGNVTLLLGDILDLGVSGLHPIEKGAMDIRAVKRDIGDRVCLLGNVDLNILGQGTPEDVEREVCELIRDIGPGGGYIVTSGNSLTDYVKPENAVALADAVQTYGEYPLDGR